MASENDVVCTSNKLTDNQGIKKRKILTRVPLNPEFFKHQVPETGSVPLAPPSSWKPFPHYIPTQVLEASHVVDLR